MRRTVEMRGRTRKKYFGTGGRKANQLPPLTEEQKVWAAEHIRLAHHYAHTRPIPRGMTPEDWRAECLLQYARSVATYDPSRGSFSTWAFTFMDLVAVHWRNYWGAVGRSRAKTGALSETVERALADGDGTALDSLCREDVVDQYQTVLAILPDEWREVARRVSHGETFEAIGCSIGISKQVAEQRFKRAIQYIRSWAQKHGVEAAL